ncbi:LETM1 domain-containing protein 1 [Melanaphis sacchari]|uniref:LETM1 domain-containing protein 1 n=1 Tax=Melanaphis sacchari TaxID=742174 RepID=UPI000DC1548A|nr:LETM1 domain-containing protein 1 [Melanaphis sacchari]
MKFMISTSRRYAATSCKLLTFENNTYKNCRFFRNSVVLQLPSKEPLKTDAKPSTVPPYISGNSVDNANQCLQSTEKKNASLNNTVVKHDNKLDNKQNMDETKILNDNNFTMRLVNRIENWSPSTAKYARLSVFGCKYLYKDVLVLLSAYKKYYSSDLSSLTYAELELKYRLPLQLVRLTPILIFWPVPFTNLFLFPLAFMFPKYLLSEHFWTDEQLKEYWIKDQQNSFEHNTRVFEHLSLMAEECSDDMLLKWFRVIECLGAGGVSPVEDIIQAIPVFTMFPYHFSTLPRQHIKVLLKMYNMHRGWRRRVRLKNLAQYIQLMDKAIESEGGPDKLNDRQLQWACLFRGLNPFSSSRETLVLYLKDWIKISSNIDNDSLSCILHCQVLLALNRPENDILKKTE